MWIRYVLVPGYTDDPAETELVAALAESLGNVERVEVLPFHTLGQSKYDALGIPFPLADTPSPDAESLAATRAIFATHGLTVH